MARPAPYSYSDAGFNGFFRRTLVSNPMASVLGNSQRSAPNQLNFDQLQISGALGDKLRFGRIVIDGKTGRIGIEDENGSEVMWIGYIDA